MAKKKEITVEEKLRSLYNVQLIDSRIDKIRDIRGELPLEVRDLEDEIEGLKSRIEKSEQGLEEINEQISIKKNIIAEAKVLMKKYTEQQKNVRNNREFDSLTKETEFQQLEIQLAEKNINEFHFHSDPTQLPVTSILAFPKSKKDGTILKAKYLQHEQIQMMFFLVII